MIALNLPQYDFQLRNTGQNTEIFDFLRKKYVVLTPEEWVRQHFIMFLTKQLEYPSGLISVEQGLEINQRRKRADIIVHDRKGNPWMVVECKAPSVHLSEETFYQASGYHLKSLAPFLVVTNGIKHYCCQLQNGKFNFRNNFPEYPAAQSDFTGNTVHENI